MQVNQNHLRDTHFPVNQDHSTSADPDRPEGNPQATARNLCITATVWATCQVSPLGPAVWGCIGTEQELPFYSPLHYSESANH